MGQGVTLVQKTGHVLCEIVEQVQIVDQNVAAIATASHEKDGGINEVSAAINALDQGAKRSAASMGQCGIAEPGTGGRQAVRTGFQLQGLGCGGPQACESGVT